MSEEEKHPEPREFEYRFKDYDSEKVRQQIESIGGVKKHGFQLFASTVYNHPYKGRIKHTHIRIRNEGGQYKLTIKNETRSKFPIEHEINIDNKETVESMLLVLGCEKEHYVEKLREKWVLPNNTEIVFDMYPGCPEYMEVESLNETDLEETVDKLNIGNSRVNLE